jgi:membrane associated rhomboid family serine protease
MNQSQTIPRPLIRANQWTIIISVIAFLFTRASWILLIPLLSGLSSLIFGYHPIMEIVKPLLKQPMGQYIQEDKIQQRFNQILAVSMLSLSVISFWLGWISFSIFFAVMVLIACSLAVMGFCVGCYIHYQISLWRQRKIENS